MTIILTTMVRNEEKALPRLLRSCAGVVTHVALNDTGSTDKTLAVAKSTCDDLGLILSVECDTWSDFGSNRTLNLEHGRRVAARIGGVHHMLLLDADMALPAGCTFPENLPPAVMLTQRERTLEWKNVRLLATNVMAHYVGRTHEYIWRECPLETLPTPVLIDHGDGGCKADKFERDARLLRMDLDENPNNTRAMFYLASSLKSLGRVNEAKELYDRRARFNDFPEESYMARLEAMHCSTGYEADARAWEAYCSRPQRIEALAELAKRAADAGKHQYALSISDLGSRVPFPTDETLYADPAPYTWEFPYTDMVSSFYAGDLERGMVACEKLQLMHGSPYARLALDNAPFYAQKLPGERRDLPFTAPEGFTPASPCLTPDGEGWFGIVRTVNYTITPAGAFTITMDKVRTRNFMVQYDKDFNLTQEPLELVGPQPEFPESGICGLEDQRLVRRLGGDRLVTVGPRFDANPKGIPEMWLSHWDTREGRWVSGHKISVGDNVEKNWLPFQGDTYLYRHGDGVITFVDHVGAVTSEVHTRLNLSHLRGSAAPIHYKDGYLYVTHEVATRGRRVYLHRFVYAGPGWKEITISRPFLLRGSPCMESCFSISPSGDKLVMACAYEDREIYTITVDSSTVDALLLGGSQ